jgi:hypothetical protein
MQKNKVQRMLGLLACTLMLSAASGCMSVKAYQKVWLNDKDMELTDTAIESFEQGFVTYREGTSGGNGGKTGGGCGCN